MKFQGVEVTIYEIAGREFLAGKDICRCLGISEQALRKIYKNHKDELKNFEFRNPGLRNSKGGRPSRLFDETGAHLIGMFSRSERAKEFRRWLAQLPRRVRERQERLMNGSKPALPSPFAKVIPLATLEEHFLAFASECLAESPGSSLSSAEIWRLYQFWCQERGEKPRLTRKRLGLYFGQYPQLERSRTAQARFWKNLTPTVEIPKTFQVKKRKPKALPAPAAPSSKEDRKLQQILLEKIESLEKIIRQQAGTIKALERENLKLLQELEDTREQYRQLNELYKELTSKKPQVGPGSIVHFGD